LRPVFLWQHSNQDEHLALVFVAHAAYQSTAHLQGFPEGLQVGCPIAEERGEEISEIFQGESCCQEQK